MKLTLPVTLLALLPVTAFALDYSIVTSRYSDAPFSQAENAGISVLTTLGAVAGNPDGTFAANRTVNRAEFLKIAYASNGSVAVSDSDAADCFPDVRATDWFSKYVCLAKEREDIAGYPDGKFRPANAVNYVEALKMLVEMYDYTLPEPPNNERWTWYRPYLLAAQEHGTMLPGEIDAAAELTRGQMARLAAGFRAEAEGELDEYRDAERGTVASSTSSLSSGASVSSASSSSSTSSSSSSISSRSSQSSIALFPAISRFALAGTTTPVLFDGLFTSGEKDIVIQQVEVELQRKINGIESLLLVDSAGNTITTIPLQTYSNTEKTKYRIDIQNPSFPLTKATGVRLGVKAVMKPTVDAVPSNELIELKTLKLWGLDTVTNNSLQIVPTETHYPMHQTAKARIAYMHNDLATALSVPQGANRTLGTFTIGGQVATGASLTLESLSFVLRTTNANISAIHIGGVNAAQQGDCAVETDDGQTMLICLVPESMRNITAAPVTVSVYGDVSLAGNAQSGSVQLLADASIGMQNAGSTRWHDGSFTFSWVEADITQEDGPVVTIAK